MTLKNKAVHQFCFIPIQYQKKDNPFELRVEYQEGNATVTAGTPYQRKGDERGVGVNYGVRVMKASLLPQGKYSIGVYCPVLIGSRYMYRRC